MKSHYDRDVFQELALIDDLRESGFLDEDEATYLKETW